MSHLTLQAGVTTVVVTGAGSGFGLELARLGAQKGLNLVLMDVQQDSLDAVVQELRSTMSECEKAIDDFFRHPTETTMLGKVAAIQIRDKDEIREVLGRSPASPKAPDPAA